MLEVVAVDKRLGRRPVLTGVSLRCGRGEVVTVLGENGSGKSTLLRIVAGILAPDRGEVRIGGEPIGTVAARRQLGYVPDAADPLPELLVSELVVLMAALKGAPAPDRALLHRLGVAPMLAERTGTLSFGQRKRACLLLALLGEPGLLVLDEPTNGLDPQGIQVVWDLLLERAAAGAATLLATNDLPFAAAVGGARYRLDEGILRREAL